MFSLSHSLRKLGLRQYRGGSKMNFWFIQAATRSIFLTPDTSYLLIAYFIFARAYNQSPLHHRFDKRYLIMFLAALIYRNA